MIDLEQWGYVGVFVAAATPWVEILLVIPAAVALGLQAVPVGGIAFVGNALPVAGIVLAYDAWQRRRARRRGPAAALPTSARRERARRIMDRYGLPALAAAGPLVTGVHLATVIALALGAGRGRVLAWMTASLAAWTIGLVALSELGVAVFRS